MNNNNNMEKWVIPIMNHYRGSWYVCMYIYAATEESGLSDLDIPQKILHAQHRSITYLVSKHNILHQCIILYTRHITKTWPEYNNTWLLADRTTISSEP